jgi:hypothetical protein
MNSNKIIYGIPASFSSCQSDCDAVRLFKERYNQIMKHMKELDEDLHVHNVEKKMMYTQLKSILYHLEMNGVDVTHEQQITGTVDIPLHNSYCEHGRDRLFVQGHTKVNPDNKELDFHYHVIDKCIICKNHDNENYEDLSHEQYVGDY